MKQMTSLTEIAYWSRQTIKYSLAFLVFLVVARVAWTTGYGIYRKFNPKPPPPPTVTFGKLPPLTFSTAQQPPEVFSFNLQLPEGELPQTKTVLPVYIVQARRAYLGALEQARLKAQRLGFAKGEEQVSPTIYRFFQEETDSFLEMNIVSGIFSISSNLYQEPELLALRPPPQETAVNMVRSYLSRANLLPEDFAKGKNSAIWARNEDTTLVSSISLSEAQFVRIDLFRQDYDGLPVVSPYPNRSNVWFVLSGAINQRQVVGGEYHYFAIDQKNSATYPIKTSQQAWEELKTGKGVFISLPRGQNIVVRRVYLAYYDPPEFQEFFQPVFVFEGDDGFVGYVPAVTREYSGK